MLRLCTVAKKKKKSYYSPYLNPLPVITLRPLHAPVVTWQDIVHYMLDPKPWQRLGCVGLGENRARKVEGRRGIPAAGKGMMKDAAVSRLA